LSVAVLLAELRNKGVELALDGDHLRCSAPKGALSPELVERLRAGKAAIVDALREAADGAARVDANEKPLRPCARNGALPLSLSQQRLWFVDSLRPGTSFLNLPCAFRLFGALDVDLYRRVLQTIVDRHESLRTIVHMGPDGPEQVVLPQVIVSLNVIDHSQVPEAGEITHVRETLSEELSRAFVLSEGPLFRCGLIRCDRELYVGYFVANHLVWDGWSFDVFFHELRALYAAMSRGQPSMLEPPPIQYGDYVLWHRDWLETPAQRSEVEYWKKKLAGLPALELPRDRPRPAAMTYRGKALPFAIPTTLIGRLRELAQSRGATLYMLLLAALQVLVHRYTGQRDIVIGAPVEGRVRPETERLIGLFVNTLLLRTVVDEHASFVELLERVKTTCIEAYDHQHTPFEQLVLELRPERDRSRTPLFQVMFSYQQVQGRGTDMGPLRLEQFHVHAGSAGTDMTFWVKDDGVAVFGAFEYATDLFDRATVERMAESMIELLEALARSPDAPLATLDFLGSQREELDRWNRTDAPYARTTLIHRLFEAQVDRTPQAIALRFENEALSYRELDDRANRLARRLSALGVRADTLVGLCLHRSSELVVAMLAILKAGGAYVPLDPSYPRDRLAFMLVDSGAQVLVAEQGTNTLFDDAGVTRVLVDSERASIACESAERLCGNESAEQLAYAIYTSGSTGKPKGVLVEHRNVMCFLAGMEQRLDLSTGGAWLALTSVSFDISVLEIFGSLTHGLTVVLVGDQRLGDAADAQHSIAGLIERHRISHLQCTPSHMALLLAEPETRAALSRVRQVLVGGEALPQALASELVSATTGDVLNMYGPTETTVWSTTQRVANADCAVPIGRPIANTRVYVLDAEGRRTPIGVTGELYIGGDGVVRGYHERPALTTERFLPDPFREPGQRMYRTGDVVRMRADGVLEFFGRNDFQVKIRGHRIELGEIEQALAAHDSVNEAVVVARSDERGDSRLIAYVVAAEQGCVSPDSLREHLRSKLPPFMVPSSFLAVDSFPLTPNGKIDRKALPEPEAIPGHAPPRVAARDALEAQLVAIWEKALGVTGIGVEDDFFDIGGHSLLGVRLLSRMHAQFGVRLPLAVLFEAPNVATLAARIRARLAGPVNGHGVASIAGGEPAWTTVVPIQPRGSLPPFFCAAGKGGNPMNLVHVARQMGSEQQFFGLQHRGVDGRLTPHETVEDLAREFVRDIRRVQPQGPYYVGGFSGGGVAALEVAQQLSRAGERVAALVFLEAVNPMLPVRPLRERARDHLERLRDRGPMYFAEALRGRAQRELESLQTRVLARAAKLKPYDFRHEAVTEAWLNAARRYRPVSYAGHTILVRSRIRDTGVLEPYNGWRSVIAGELEVLEVEGNHTSFVGPEHAENTARLLVSALARARSAVGRRSPASREALPRASSAPDWAAAE
jgi:aspartate racemase